VREWLCVRIVAIKNTYLEHIPNRVACEFRRDCEMIGRMNEEHIRAGRKLLRGESLGKQMHRHYERHIGGPVDQMERNLVCGFGCVICRQRVRECVTRRLRAGFTQPSNAFAGQFSENGFDLFRTVSWALLIQ
jgi:hypothetical protein